ncbi:hypothetical protein I5L01_11600 [Erythrobacter sp. YJ-T3-07]|uniref:hypothetical protein n=1 Tax=Erythrobacter sp. YJ-T3-07 TaxID=2793063 RepID=UPI0018D3C6FA|nr:hypothetical protein [Erythrobacter sp. YJ-T3-07]MBH1944875.1 hypothetical protein [Erythrobacter sp. YJ-T3-07]
MKPKPLMAIAGLAGLLAQPAAAKTDTIPLIASPWGGSMSATQQAASAAQRPAYADANWNHEVCAIAYSFEDVPAEIARRRAALPRNHKYGPDEQEESNRLDELEREAAKHLANIPKCKGQFFRPALESLCRYRAGKNRFCDQLSGETLPGVELVEDEAGFVRGLAWNKVGNLFSQGIAFAPAPWAASEDRRIDLARTDLSGIAYIAATNRAVKAEDGSPAANSVGQWAFSIEMQRLKMADGGDRLTNLSAEFAAKTGMTTSIAEFDQFPQLHFQAYMFDILVADDAATLGLEMRDGTRRRLEQTASFRSVPGNSPTFYTSFASYRIHAIALLSPDEMRMILDPNAAFLTASFAMRLEDGRIDTVTLRTPLTGVADAWKAMNAANLDADRRIRRVLKADGGGV